MNLFEPLLVLNAFVGKSVSSLCVLIDKLAIEGMRPGRVILVRGLHVV